MNDFKITFDLYVGIAWLCFMFYAIYRAGYSRGRCNELEEAILADSNKPEVPDYLMEVGENVRAQDNRCTDQPLFIVQQKREVVADEDYDHTRIVWLCEEGFEVSELRAKRLELINEFGWRYGHEVKSCYRRVALLEIWEFVTACFTEQGCKEYLSANGHNLKAPRIYAAGSYRNFEYQQIRKWLTSLPPSTGSAT